MANGMFGANTDELRQVSDAFDMRTTVVESARRTTTRAVEATVWEGRDAEAFKQRYASEVAAMMQQLESVLQLHRTDISKQADEQDACSSGKGGGDNRPWWQRALDALKNLAGNALEKLRDLVDTIRDHVSTDGNWPNWEWSISWPSFSESRNRQFGKEYKDRKIQNADRKDDKSKFQLGVKGVLDLFSRNFTIDAPGGHETLDAYIRAGADLFFGFDVSEKNGKTEYKAGAEAGVSADAGIDFTQHGGYLDLTYGAEGSAGLGAEAKVAATQKDGRIDFSGKAKLVVGLGGSLSAGGSVDYERAMHDFRNNPGTFLTNAAKDVALIHPTTRGTAGAQGRIMDLSERIAGAIAGR